MQDSTTLVEITKDAHKQAKLLAVQRGVKLNELMTDLVLAGLDAAKKPITTPPPPRKRGEA